MLQRRSYAFAAGVCLFIALLGVPLIVANYNNYRENGIALLKPQGKNGLDLPKSGVLSLVSLSPSQRAAQLQEIAQQSTSRDRSRARYLLASDFIIQRQGDKAIAILQDLEKDYPELAAHIALKRAQAYSLTGDKVRTQAAWQDLLQRHSKSPVAAEALFVLGKNEPQYWQEAIALFPSHPRSLEIARLLLQQNPQQPRLQLLLAQYDYQKPEIVPVLDRLVSQSATQLKPQHWQIVAQAYWENREYGKAAVAYAKSPRIPRNVYRWGRGLQLSTKQTEAISVYKQLVAAYPNAEESGMALMRLARISKPAEAIAYLDRIVNRFPKQAGEALVAKANLLDNLNSKQSAAKVRQFLLDKYGDSKAAAEYRWQVAQEKAAKKDYQAATRWAEVIPLRNPESILAPRAGFWVGKWAQKLGKSENAKTAFESVLSKFPQSYYAWRSATLLGLDVGNFNTVRQMNPEFSSPQRVIPPAGSPALKELYQLGQDAEALALWQVEYSNPEKPTIAEQFTNGLMYLAKGENLIGINEISTLEDRDIPLEKAEYQNLSKQLGYWQARYPFPYLPLIQTWAQQHQLNPLLVTALIRQESRFEPTIRSVAGAVGLMQVMPGTAQYIAEKINVPKYDLENPQDNIQLGTWYMDYTHNRFDNSSLLAIASYNAGWNNVEKWLKRFNTQDPDEFVELIPFGETQGYVRQVFGNYWNYLRLYNPQVSQLVTKYSDVHPSMSIDVASN
ncbi:transglycosylase SLT domain-containing protein [Chroococcidiopsis sp. FACHB-1243]|uniref:lytic transglycosylase domain-containing protein n=1 Tax=Chroococcidiopsis sp. [FACHB-1243] TaxID=2692781 RepID=UPI00178680FF|nr:transglycosylase SLT domain-containing protein [Chroococcidiopsis sp. [FACHB-1243]]MBD2306940.1 transglycosylase SLT domain-containing protein [Chroococcidiopsis sp. [FACHB-1243]]